MASQHVIAIAGISGKLARYVVQELLKQPDVQIRGSCRDITKLPTELTESPRISLVKADPFDVETLRNMVRGCDTVMCCYYADDKTMFEGQIILIDLCEEEGVGRYIASDYTADFTRLDLGDIVVKDPMKHVKAYLDTKERVKGIHILVGLMMETFLEYFQVWNPEENTLRYWGTGSEKWDLITYGTAAEYVAAVALDRHATGVLKCKSGTRATTTIHKC